MNKFEEAIQEATQKRPPKELYTIGEFVSAVFSITNESDALEFYKGYLLYQQSHPDRESSNFTDEQATKQNIGWCFGEGMDPEKIEMWIKVCGASHPVFGTTIPTTREAFEAGLQMGRGSLTLSILASYPR